SFREVDRQSFDVGAPGWYLSNSAVDCRVRVRLGVDDRGGFTEALTSNLLQVPREGPGGAPEIWIDRRTAGGPSPSETVPPSRPPADQVEPRAAAERVTSPGHGPVWETIVRARTPNLTGA